MKSNATMHSIAKASAILQGPRVVEIADGKKIIAVWNSPDELRKIYGREGFRIPQHESKIATWSECFGDCGYLRGGVYYDISQNTGLLLAAERLAKETGIDSIVGC